MAENTTNGTRVFVYGTLKAGHPNHRLLRDAKMLGRETLAGFKMVSLGGFPGAVPAEQGVIHGEVYEVTERQLLSLDVLEGHPDFYKRSKVPTAYKNAWIYLLGEEYLKECPLVESGVWHPSDEEAEYVRSARASAL